MGRCDVRVGRRNCAAQTQHDAQDTGNLKYSMQFGQGNE
jgi:hypothetical protein